MPPKPVLGAALLAGALLIQPAAQAAPAATAYLAPLAQTPMNQIVQGSVYPQLDYLFDKLAAEKGEVTLDGVAAFKGNDKFLPGKIAAGLAHVLLNMRKDDPRLPQRLREFRAIADLTAGMDNHTWGTYYYLQALYSLKKAGLLEQAVSAATLASLKSSLDWRKFVTTPGFELINLPTNYFGVAFSVARLRMLLGWEDDSASQVLLDKMMKHYAAYSGRFGFSDETPGDGRFDRYSILLAAEICERFIETGMTVTPELKAMLRKAAELALKLGNSAGEGFSFGRSLGPYGETAILEILSVSAYLEVLTPEEKQYAYSYANHIVARYVDFWYDPAIHSVDMWGKGRRTDAYRGKHRILGENFSLLHQLIFTNELWNKAGMRGKTPRADLQAWFDKTQPQFSLTWYAQGEYDRALALYRDKGHVFSLNMVNGGPSQHANSPYYPLPFANGVISGTADSGPEHAQLLPKFTLADGSELIGAAYIKQISAARDGARQLVRYRQDALDKLGKGAPVKDDRIALETEYSFESGKLTRTDTYTPRAPVKVANLSLEFASFSGGASVDGTQVRFTDGAVSTFSVSGLAGCGAEGTGGREPFKAPYGPMKTHVTCATRDFMLAAPLTVSWVIQYD
ncbi:MAG: hypothetical protein JWP34_996 [Massilia sp.]|nr:hypothetical protein [Massilia sp.]